MSYKVHVGVSYQCHNRHDVIKVTVIAITIPMDGGLKKDVGMTPIAAAPIS